MPSILIFCKTLLKGGAEKQALTLSKLLTEKENKIILVSWCGNKIDKYNLDFINSNNIRFIGLSGWSLKKLRNLLKIIREEEINIVLSYLTKANLIAGICNLFNKDLITVGGIRTEKLPFYKLCIEKLVHNHLNDGTVFNNFSGKEKFVQKGFDPSKVHIIPNTIHIPEEENASPDSEIIKIISVCRFVKSKDFRTALYSFKKLLERNEGKRIKYLIVGYGPLEKGIRSMVRNLNLGNDVEILINPPGISGIIKSSHIYLSTSLYEGLSNSIMEAMVAGLPVIATDVGDNRYLVKDSYNGFIVQCGKIDQIAEKLEYLTKFEEIRNEFGARSYSIIVNEFSEEKFLENYFKYFDQMSLSLQIARS